MNSLRRVLNHGAMGTPRMSLMLSKKVNPMRGIYVKMNYQGPRNVIKDRKMPVNRAALNGKFRKIKQLIDKNWDATPLKHIDLRGDHAIHTTAYGPQRGMTEPNLEPSFDPTTNLQMYYSISNIYIYYFVKHYIFISYFIYFCSYQ